MRLQPHICWYYFGTQQTVSWSRYFSLCFTEVYTFLSPTLLHFLFPVTWFLLSFYSSILFQAWECLMPWCYDPIICQTSYLLKQTWPLLRVKRNTMNYTGKTGVNQESAITHRHMVIFPKVDLVLLWRKFFFSTLMWRELQWVILASFFSLLFPFQENKRHTCLVEFGKDEKSPYFPSFSGIEPVSYKLVITVLGHFLSRVLRSLS